jgi:[ribosomal protein S5]-alanine N-acetyltransferase
VELVPINERLEDNEEFINNSSCQEILKMSVDFYKVVGFNPPWICYFVKKNGMLIGSGGIKGKPKNETIEIGYGTFEEYRHQGIGTEICKELIDISLKEDPNVRITARTLPEMNHSAKILAKNNFIFIGTVQDPEDGLVWEWEYKTSSK